MIIGILLGLLVLELLLRFLPVTDSTYIQPTSNKDPYMHFKKNRDFMYSKGAYFQINTLKKSNNYGFLDKDFNDKGEQIVAVIGDSFVEALQVNINDTFHELLEGDFKSQNKFYAIGISGSPLSQYLAYIKFSKENFQNGFLLIPIIQNDFDRSLLKYKQSPGFHYFNNLNKKCSNINMIRKDFKGHNWMLKLARKSALVRYVKLNLSVSGSISKVSEKQPEAQRVFDSKCAIDEFFRRLPKYSGLPENKVLFVLDAPRPAIYNKTNTQKTYFDIMRAYFKKQARLLNYEVLDLKYEFLKDYTLNKKKFEFDIDSHWNEHGHKTLYEAIKHTDWYEKIKEGDE